MSGSAVPSDPVLAAGAAGLLACLIAAAGLWLRARAGAARAARDLAALEGRLGRAVAEARRWETLLREGLADLPQAVLLCDEDGLGIAESAEAARRGLQRRHGLRDRLRESRALAGPLVVVERAPDGVPVRITHQPLGTGGFLVIEERLDAAVAATPLAV